jgi:hypothetical protein
VVRAISFQAFNETGLDFLGSDEVVVTIRTPQYLLKFPSTSKYGSVDSDGKSHAFRADGNCIIPATDSGQFPDGKWACHEQGTAAPLSFVIAAYEQDNDYVAGLYEIITEGFFSGFDVPPLESGTDLQPLDTFLRWENSPNHLIGKDRAEHSLAELLERLPRVGDRATWNKVLRDECDFSIRSGEICAVDDEPLYDVVYEIRRVNNAGGVAPSDPNL